MDLFLFKISSCRKHFNLLVGGSRAGAFLVSLAILFTFIGVQPAMAYNWVTNPAKIEGITLNGDGSLPDANVCNNSIDLTVGIDNVTNFTNADEQIIYLYEVSTGNFINANGHNGTGAGLLDVGAALALQAIDQTNGNIGTIGGTEKGYHIHSNFRVQNGSTVRNMLGFTEGRHGDGLFFDRGHGNDDVNDDWSFSVAGTSSGGLQEVYIYSDFDNGRKDDGTGGKGGYNGVYYISIRPDALSNAHFAFNIAKSDDGKTVPSSAAKFIIVTRGMLKQAFKLAADVATVDQPVDASWQMYDEDFIRTQAGHTGIDKDAKRKWKINANISDDKFWPVGGDGASGNQYIGNAETDATFDYDRYYGVKLPNAFQGKFYQDVNINTNTDKGGYAGWYKFSVKGISADTGNSLYATANDATQSSDLLDVNFFSTDNKDVVNPLAYHTLNDGGYVAAYYANVDQNADKYFRRVFEAETSANEIAKGTNYEGQTGDGSNHNSENDKDYSALIAHNGNPIDFTFNIPNGCAGSYIVTAIAKNCDGKKNVTVTVNANTEDAQTINIDGADNKSGTFLFGARLNEGSNTISFKSNTTADLILDRMIVEKGVLESAVPKVTSTPSDVTPAVDAAGKLATSLDNVKSGNTVYNFQNGTNVKSNSGNHDPLTIAYNNTTDKDHPYFGNVGMGNYLNGQFNGRTDKNQTKAAYVKANGGDNEIYFKLPLVPEDNDQIWKKYTITLYGYGSDDKTSTAYVGFNEPTDNKNHNTPRPWYDYNNHPADYEVDFSGKDYQHVQFTASLRGSQNIMSIGSGAAGWAPDICYVTIQPADESDGQINDNGKKFITLKPNATHDFNVNVAGSGDYHVGLWYANDKESKVTIAANGKTKDITLDKSYTSATGRDVISPYSFFHLNSGDNTITVTNTSDVPINITDIAASPGIPAELELGQDFDKAVRSKAASVVLYLPSTTDKDYTTVQLGINKQSTSNPVFFDDFRIDYLGDTKGIVLDENQTSWDYVEDQLTQAEKQNKTLKNTPVCFVHAFTTDKPTDVGVADEHNRGQWTTIALPFDLYRNPLTVAFGTYVKVGELDASPGRTINFKVIDLNDPKYDKDPVIKKGRPYFIKVATEGQTLADGDINRLVEVDGKNYYPTDKDNKHSKKFYPIFADLSGNNIIHESDFNNGIAEGKYTAEGHDNATLSFVPVMYRQKLPTTGVYVFNNGSLGYYTSFKKNDGTSVAYNIFGFRGYLVDDYYSSPSTPQAKPYYFEDSTTGIVHVVENIDADDAKSLSPADNKVYNLNGQQVQANELQRGVYIRNGKKFIVK